MELQLASGVNAAPSSLGPRKGVRRPRSVGRHSWPLRLRLADALARRLSELQREGKTLATLQARVGDQSGSQFREDVAAIRARSALRGLPHFERLLSLCDSLGVDAMVVLCASQATARLDS